MPAVETAAIQAWAKYESTVRTGGTPEQRQWAYANAAQAEENLARHDRAKLKQRAASDTQEIGTAA